MMDESVVWVVVGYVSQLHGVFSTEKRAEIQRELLKRDGVATMPPKRSILNREHEVFNNG